MIRKVFADPIPERTSWRYTATLTKEDGTALGTGEAGLTLTLTVYALNAAQTLILPATNILNDGTRGTLDAAGQLAVVLLAGDNPVLDATLAKEKHVALLELTWGGGTHAARHELLFTVINLAKVG